MKVFLKVSSVYIAYLTNTYFSKEINAFQSDKKQKYEREYRNQNENVDTGQISRCKACPLRVVCQRCSLVARAHLKYLKTS